MEHVDRIDLCLAGLGRGVGAMRLRIGEGLARLDEVGGYESLGFPSLDSYCRQALERSGRWGADVRALARRLAGLPLLRAALLTGRLGSSMVELLSRVATPSDESDWIAEAETSTVRAMRVRVKTPPEEDERAPRVTISRTVDRLDAWAFERARKMVEAVGVDGPDGAVEAILAEGLTELMAHRDVALPEDLGARTSESNRALRAEAARLHEEGEAAVEMAFLVARDEQPAASLEAEEIAWGESAGEIDARLRAIASEMAWRDFELGSVAREFSDRELWKLSGYVSFDQYCRERMGLSPSSVATRIALSRRVGDLPEIEDAVVSGRIGYEAATMIARVAGRATVGAWIERAGIRTVRQLREEVDTIDMIARAEGIAVRAMGPPDDETMAGAHALERDAIACITGQMSGEREEGEVDEVAEVALTTLHVRMSDDLGYFWRELEAAHARLGRDESFLAFLVQAVLRAWRGVKAPRDAYADVYLRDRWRCMSPVCSGRDPTPHHVVFRSRGGSDERTNVISLCARCHLDLVHGGKLNVTGEAGSLVWRAAGWGYPFP